MRRDAILNMAFNLGVGGLLTFRNMLLALTAGDWMTAARHARQSDWYQQVGPRAERIAQMIETGVRP